MIDQVVHRVLETAGQQLPLQIHREKPRAGVDCFVAGHDAFLSSTSRWSLDIPFGSRQDARDEQNFSTAR